MQAGSEKEKQSGGTACAGRRLTVALAASVTSGALLLLISCSSDSPEPATIPNPNAAYYETLKNTSYINAPQAQPPAHEMFLEDTKQFDLVQVPAKQLARLAAAQTLPANTVLYAPRGTRTAGIAKSAAAAAPPGAGIPSFKPADIIPDVCAGTSGYDLRQCLDDNNIGMAPAPVHISYHDSQTLSILLGDAINERLLANLSSSFNTHIDGPTRHALETRLNSYIAANASHSSLNLSLHDIFNPAGYFLNSAVITDGSQSDSNNDGVLESHSTLIVEVKKVLNYTRSANVPLDAAIKKYSPAGITPDERYEITLKAYIHLDQLSSFRQTIPLPPAEMLASSEQQLAYYEQLLQAQAMNHAFDTNIIGKIFAGDTLLPWNSTEYSVSFQLSPDTISGLYAPMLEMASANGDSAAVDAIESHMDAQTALLTGNGSATNNGQAGVTVMYQVNLPTSVKKAGESGGYDYAMVDSLGRRVSIYDPVTGTVVYAGIERKNDTALNKRVAFTSAGACRDDKRNWAYWPSRVRTPRFGRGSQWILTEWLLHNQVSDYKNIHWYQSVWKAGTQVAIKAGTFIFTTYLKIQSGSVGIPSYKGGKAAVYLVEGVLPYFANSVSNMGKGKEFKIAGYELQGLSLEYQFLVQLGVTTVDNPTFLEKVGDGVKNAAIGFAIDRLGQGLAQTLDVQAVGWQDFSDGSHHGCFQFD